MKKMPKHIVINVRESDKWFFKPLTSESNIFDNYIIECCEPFILKIGEGTIGIEKESCYWQKELTKIIFPSTLEWIGNKAFIGCNSLEEIYIPKNVKRIGDFAFANTRPNIILNIKNLKYVGQFAFDFQRLMPCGTRICPNIECGEISNEEDGNRFPFLNSFRRICDRTFILSDGEEVIISYTFEIGEPINKEDKYFETGVLLSKKHSGFQKTKPTRKIKSANLDSMLILGTLDGNEYPIQGFFKDENKLNIQQLVSKQHSYLGKSENAWSIFIPWKDEPVKVFSKEEIILNCIDGNIDILEPILIVYDK